MAIGVVGVTALYLLVNFALLHVLSPAQMAVSNLPAADAAQSSWVRVANEPLTMFGVLSVAAITNLTIMKAARIPFADGASGAIAEPASTGRVSRHAALGADSDGRPFGGVRRQWNLHHAFGPKHRAEPSRFFWYVNVAAMRLRQTEPKLGRPFQIPLYPVPVLLAIVINLLLLAGFVYEDAVHSIEGFALLAVIASVYATFGWTRKRAPPQPT